MTDAQALKVLDGDFTEIELQEGESHNEIFAEAYHMAKAALSKQIPRKPIEIQGDPDCKYCPSCEIETDSGNIKQLVWHGGRLMFDHCPNCGQAIDGSKTDE